MLWADLNHEQQVLLTAWFILADVSPPEEDDLPLEVAPALCYLAIITGKNRGFQFQKSPGGAQPGYHMTPNHRRIVRARKVPG